MLQVVPTADIHAFLKAHTAEAALDPQIVQRAREICDDVCERGDTAVVEYTHRYDNADVSASLRVPEDRIDEAVERCDREFLAVMRRLASRLRLFHERQKLTSWEAHHEGVRFGERVRPIPSVACYAPFGTSPYPSTVLMTCLPATVADVPRIVLSSPPAVYGSVAADFLVAAHLCGVREIYQMGGAQAIAALAFGTESVRRVDKLVGPGNAYVNAAKQYVRAYVGLDSLAGPSDATIVADGSADPAGLAAELLAQAEHDEYASAFLIVTDERVLVAVLGEVERQIAELPRREIARTALRRSAAFLCASLDETLPILNQLAPEHLLLWIDEPDAYLDRVESYGAAFLGHNTSVVFGDYGGTSNHTLPTLRTARYSSGLRTTEFQVSAAFVELSATAVDRVAPDVEVMAAREQLAGHAAAARMRRERLRTL